MRRPLWFFVIAFFVAWAGCAGCVDETGQQDNESTAICEPGEAHCEDDQVVRCNSDGTGYLEPQSCDSDVCVDGQCGCANQSDCADGELCSDGLCLCPSQVHCGDDGTCCGEGEICDEVEICDDDEQCEVVALCRPACEGSFCGVTAEICCEGDTPECGPYGDCAPDCSSGGGLCGDDFDECCAFGDACVFGECRQMGEPCDSFVDCDFGEYCDPGLGRCMPDDFPGDIECSREGEFEEMEITEKWSWTDEDIISIPVVGDVTGDGEPNVVVNASRVDGGTWPTGRIHILDSAGEEVRRINHDPASDSHGSYGRSNIALGDLTGDGVMEIIYATRGNHIAAINGNGDLLWLAHDEGGTPVTVTVHNGAISVGNFDGDPDRAQVVAGAMLIDSDGLVMWNEGDNGPVYGTNSGYTGGVSVIADLTGDGKNEIVSGRHAWAVDWPDGATSPAEVSVEPLWVHDGPDGFPAVADMNGDGNPEVVLVAASTVRILEGTTGELLCGVDPTGQACEDDDSLRTQPIGLPGPSSSNRGGPPTVADFDGDGRPEIGVAGGYYYAVFDLYRPNFGDDPEEEDIDTDLLDEFGQAHPDVGDLFVRWRRETMDLSSNATGSSVFDFQGDGSASVVYADECYMRVYSGTDGEVELEIMNSTGTILEYPLVVDVDQNGRSEILVVANDVDWGCSDDNPDYQSRSGLFVYEDPHDRWVRTRSVWNQHAYSIDNIGDDGRVPEVSDGWWQTHNTFRANRQGEVPLNAADVAVTSVQVNENFCPPDWIFFVTVENHGVASIPAGLPISIYDTGGERYLYTTELDEPIPPGGVITVEIVYEVAPAQFNTTFDLMVIANDDGSGDPSVYDCNPDKAAYLLDPLECRIEM